MAESARTNRGNDHKGRAITENGVYYVDRVVDMIIAAGLDYEREHGPGTGLPWLASLYAIEAAKVAAKKAARR